MVDLDVTRAPLSVAMQAGLYALLFEAGAHLDLVKPGLAMAGEAARRLAALSDGPAELRHALLGAAEASEQAIVKLDALRAAVAAANRVRLEGIHHG